MMALAQAAGTVTAHMPCREDSRAGGAGAGLVSFSNKSDTLLADAEKHDRRMWRMRRGVIASARLINNDLVDRGEKFRAALGTLTYAPGVDWSPRHVSALIDCYRKWAMRRGFKFRAVWKLEPHASGRPHYHYVFWMPRGVTPPMPDKQGWWPHGSTNVKWARSPVGYIAKYCAKPAEDVFPKGARIWGAVGLSAAERARVQWSLAPRWVKRMTSPEHGVRRIKRPLKRQPHLYDAKRRIGFWTNADSAETADWLPSLWTCMKNLFSFEAPHTCEGFKDGALVLRPRERARAWDQWGNQFFYSTEKAA